MNVALDSSDARLHIIKFDLQQETFYSRVDADLQKMSYASMQAQEQDLHLHL